jgi:peptidoglycan hydrolase CwlO-like protein
MTELTEEVKQLEERLRDLLAVYQDNLKQIDSLRQSNTLLHDKIVLLEMALRERKGVPDACEPE